MDTRLPGGKPFRIDRQGAAEKVSHSLLPAMCYSNRASSLSPYPEKRSKRSIHVKILFLHPYGSNFIKGVDDITTIFNLMPHLGILSIAAWVVINACFYAHKAFSLYVRIPLYRRN